MPSICLSIATGAAAETAVKPSGGGPIVSSKGADGVRRITMAEVEQHDQDNDVWIVVKDKVSLALLVI